MPQPAPLPLAVCEESVSQFLKLERVYVRQDRVDTTFPLTETVWSMFAPLTKSAQV